MPIIEYVIGVDLGQAQDYSAMAVLHRRWGRDPKEAWEHRKLWHFVPTLWRWDLNTPYPTIFENVIETYDEFDYRSPGGVRLIIDQTGPGRPVLDMFKHARRTHRTTARAIGVTITGGMAARENRRTGDLTAPKRDICSALVVSAQSGDLKVPKTHPFAQEFDAEVSNFGYKVNLKSGYESYDAIDQNVHDDMVLAAAMALWYSTECLSTTLPGTGRKAEVVNDYNPFAREHVT